MTGQVLDQTVPYRTVPTRTLPYRTVPYQTLPYRTVNAPRPAVRQPPVVVHCHHYQAVATRGPNHVLHLLLTFFTGGLWLPIWLIIAIRNKQTVV